jgi:RNA polymerase sigma-70 factor (ECF subfamily)
MSMNAPRTRSDAELMAAMHSTNGDALAHLFRRYVRMVYRVAFDVLRDAGEAEDVVQEVFLEVYRRSHVYDRTRGSVRGWLFQYARHRSLRRKDALRRRVSYRSEPLEDTESSTHDDVLDLTRQERRWVLRAGLAQLSERQRTTLELTCLEELSLRDVAERLSVPLGAVRHYYYRGLSRLRAWALVSGIGETRGTGESRASGSSVRSFRGPATP